MIKCFVLVAVLAGCVAPTAPTTGNGVATNASASSATTSAAVDRYAYKSQKVEESVEAFVAICMQPDLTVNRAASAAKNLQVGLTAPTQYRTQGNPSVYLVARRDGDGMKNPDDLFEWYRCTLDIRGRWADTVFSATQAKLSAAGFRTTTSFDRQTQVVENAYNQDEAVLYSGTLARNGREYVLTISQGASGADRNVNYTVRYSGGTRIEVETK